MRELFLLVIPFPLLLGFLSCSPDPTSPDSDPEPSCPAEMVLIPANPNLGIDVPFCIDEYEASRPDATETDQGVDTSMALSLAGVIPWHVNPMSSDALDQMRDAAGTAGKRLCTAAEWTAACSGNSGLTYAYGNVFDPLACNCVDSFCAEYCADNGIAPVDCSTDANCGYTYSCFFVVPTGDFEDCRSGQGVFDLNGNVWEVVLSSIDPRGYEIRGGGFNDAGAAGRLQCDFNADWSNLYAGFRCCRDPD